jgi:type II secretory ATPase GspE/PulE/Tfp pilus assembly ATPase PilB-like protein
VVYVDSVLTEFVDVAFGAPVPTLTVPPDTEPLPVARLVNLLFLEAINGGANRVHIRPTVNSGRVDFRIGGAWVTRDELSRRLLPGVATRIAMMSGIALEVGREGRAGGEFRFDYHGAVYTVRTAIEVTALGPVIDLDISDHFELA